MKKKQALALCLCLITCYAFVTFNVGASISTQTTISSYGSVSGNNLNPLSDFMNSSNVPNMPMFTPAQYDPNFGYNGNPSILDTDIPITSAGEVDGAWVSCSPGDHIDLSIWVYTTNSTSTDIQSGTFFGFNFCGETSAGFGEIGSNGLQASMPDQNGYCVGVDNYDYTINGESGITQVAGLIDHVPFGVGTWTQLQFDFIVPSTYYNQLFEGTANTIVSCNPVQINSICAWLGVRSSDGTGIVYFSDPIMYDLGQTSLP